MKKRGVACLIFLWACLVYTRGDAYTFNEYLEWGQKERLSAAISETVFLLNSEPLQLGNAGNRSHARMRTGLEGQFRFFEIPQWGKLEGFVDLGLFTNQDIWDKLDAAAGLRVTVARRIGFDFGTRNIVNVGAKNQGWGGRQYWLGICGIVFESHEFFIDACGRYHFISNLSPIISNTLEHKNPLTLEAALRVVYYPREYLALGLLLSAPFDQGVDVRGVSASPWVEYFLGRHFVSVPEGISLIAQGDFRMDINASSFNGDSKYRSLSPRKKSEEALYFTFKWKFK